MWVWTGRVFGLFIDVRMPTDNGLQGLWLDPEQKEIIREKHVEPHGCQRLVLTLVLRVMLGLLGEGPGELPELSLQLFLQISDYSQRKSLFKKM